MKKCHLMIVTAVLVCFLLSCGNSNLAPAEASASQTEHNHAAFEGSGEEIDLLEKKKSIAALETADFRATCEEKHEIDDEFEDPIIIKTCWYRNFKSVSIGSPDYVGRYSWNHQLSKSEQGKEIEITNSSLFNEKQNELLKQVNQKVKANYQEMLASDSESDSRCFEGVEAEPHFEMNALGISFDEDRIRFYADFRLSNACFAVGGTTVSFKLKDIEQYLST